MKEIETLYVGEANENEAHHESSTNWLCTTLGEFFSKNVREFMQLSPLPISIKAAELNPSGTVIGKMSVRDDDDLADFVDIFCSHRVVFCKKSPVDENTFFVDITKEV